MFSWLAYNALCAVPLAALALVARRLARGRPGVEHALWTLVLVRLVMPPLAFASPSELASAAARVIPSGAPGLANELMAEVTRTFGSNWSTWALRGLVTAFLGLLTWIITRELVRARRVERLVALAAPAELALERHVRAVAQELGLAAPSVRVSTAVASPFLWSLRRPVLVLPAADPHPPATVLAHEFAHLARRDHWTAWLELVVQGFHFWNPLFWLARRGLHRAAELDCDRFAVARFPTERRAFATALVDTAERARAGVFVPRAVQAIGTDARDFEERLREILRAPAGPRPLPSLVTMPLAALLLAASTLAVPDLTRFRAALPPLPADVDEEMWGDQLADAEADLARAPDDGAALARRGLALLGLGRAEEALATYQRQFELGWRPAVALYNQACCWVRLGERENALLCLEEAVALDPETAAMAAVDSDLEALRGEARFEGLVAR